MIKLGAVYSSNNHKRFVIEKIVEDAQGTWVHYRDNVRNYNCLLDAFLARFTEVANESRK